jgi:hypothetical protein
MTVREEARSFAAAVSPNLWLNELCWPQVRVWQGQPPALRDPTIFLRFLAAAESDSKLVALRAEDLNVFFPLRRLLVSREVG